MLLNVTLIGIIVLVILVWVVLEFKRFRHKIFAVFLVLAILFTYFSFTFALSGKNLDFSTWNGISHAGTIYLSWLGSVFLNLKALTANAIHMNWGVSQASSNVSISSNLTNS